MVGRGCGNVGTRGGTRHVARGTRQASEQHALNQNVGPLAAAGMANPWQQQQEQCTSRAGAPHGTGASCLAAARTEGGGVSQQQRQQGECRASVMVYRVHRSMQRCSSRAGGQSMRGMLNRAGGPEHARHAQQSCRNSAELLACCCKRATANAAAPTCSCLVQPSDVLQPPCPPSPVSLTVHCRCRQLAATNSSR